MVWRLVRVYHARLLVMASPADEPPIHLIAAITADCRFADDLVQRAGQFSVRLIRHLEAVAIAVGASRMHVGRIAIKQRVRRVVTTDHIGRRTVFDLHPQQTRGDVGQAINAAQP